ncbi:Uncharacterised protein [Klebsiella pneumoniae]|nr:Uncharacterised protein [Klebsiella pneumoniae]
MSIIKVLQLINSDCYQYFENLYFFYVNNEN